MSHDSGFRRGGSDFTHQQKARSSRKRRGGDRFEQRRAQRFHEREAMTQEQGPEQGEETEQDES